VSRHWLAGGDGCDAHDGRSEDDDEESGKSAKEYGEQHRDGNLQGPLLGHLATLDPLLTGLNPEDPATATPNTSAWTTTSAKAPSSETPQRWARFRIASGHGELHLQGTVQLLGQRAAGVGRYVPEGRVEAEPRPDADGEQVDRAERLEGPVGLTARPRWPGA
jgi:hypothetical protein